MQFQHCDTCKRMRNDVADLMTEYASADRTRQALTASGTLASVCAERSALHAGQRLALARHALLQHLQEHQLCMK